jgi:CRP-like cAMP-binding protein
LAPGTHDHQNIEHVTTFRAGQIAGELAMLDQGGRSADLIAGEEGAVVLSLNRQRLLTLCEDDAVLGTRLLWNISTVMSRRVRFILWQLNRAEQRRQVRA